MRHGWGETLPSWRFIAVTGVAAYGGLLVLRVSSKLYRALSHREHDVTWLPSIVPPPSYSHKSETDSHAWISKEHPSLLDIVENGTLTVLTRPKDFDRPLPDEIYILGTAHVSRKTADAVYRTIYEVEPDAVVVELCRSRTFMMFREVTPDKWALNDSTASTSAATTVSPILDSTVIPGSITSACTTDTTSSSITGTTGIIPTTEVAASHVQLRVTPAVPVPSTASQLRTIITALRGGANILQVLIGAAYQKIEAQLGTVAGLEFIRAWHAIQDLETKPGRSYPPPSLSLDGSRMGNKHTSSSLPQGPAGSGVGQALPTADATPSLNQRDQGTASPDHGSPPLLTSSGSWTSVSGISEISVSPGQASTDGGETEVQVEAGTVGDGQDQAQHRPGEASEVHGEAGTSSSGHVAPRVTVYWGDVPLQRTLSRAWGVLNVRQKLRLAYMLLKDCLTVEADDAILEQLLAEDMLDLLQKELGKDFPQLMGPLLHERNWHLAYTLHQAAQHGMKRVVLVVGRGHVPGVTYALMQPWRMRKENALYRSASGAALPALPESAEMI